MKRSELLFNLFTVPLDIVMLLLAALLAYYTRLHSTDLVGPVQYALAFKDFFITAATVAPVVILILAVLGLYNLRGTRKFSDEFTKILLGVSLALFFVIILFFFNQRLFPSRFIILATWGYAVAFVFVGRFVMHQIQKFMFRHGYGLHNLVIVNGTGMESEAIGEMLQNRSYGYHVLRELDYSADILRDLEDLYTKERIDEIIQANPTLPVDANLQLVEFAKNKGLQFSFVPNLFDVQRNVIEMQDWAGVPVVSIKNTPLDGWGKVAKRVLDIVGSLGAMIILSPAYIAIYLAIKIDSPGRAIYPALRGGQRKDFWFYKFRSMYTHMSVGAGFGGEEAERLRQELWKKNNRGGENGPFLKIKQDPRVTRVGRFIRKTKLDEIPQFWNVLKGDMSLVGPRAHVLDEVERYRNRYRRMFSIKPGIFGMSQTAQLSWPDLPFEEEIRLNTYYIENWSLWLDIKILAKSFYLIFFGDKSKEDY